MVGNVRTKIGFHYSPYLDLLVSVPQEPILDPLLFNVYIHEQSFSCDCESDIIAYVGNTILYACERNMDLALNKLE